MSAPHCQVNAWIADIRESKRRSYIIFALICITIAKLENGLKLFILGSDCRHVHSPRVGSYETQPLRYITEHRRLCIEFIEMYWQFMYVCVCDAILNSPIYSLCPLDTALILT